VQGEERKNAILGFCYGNYAIGFCVNCISYLPFRLHIRKPSINNQRVAKKYSKGGIFLGSDDGGFLSPVEHFSLAATTGMRCERVARRRGRCNFLSFPHPLVP
jgi:hypothetical protein